MVEDARKWLAQEETPEKLWDAFQKLQEIRSSHSFCCIDLDSDYDLVWDIHVAWDERDQRADGHRKITPCTHSHRLLSEAIYHLYIWWEAQEPILNK